MGARTRPAPSVPKVRLFGLGLAQVHGARRARRARSQKASQAAETSPRERRRDPSCSPSRQGNHCRHCTSLHSSKGARSATSCFSGFVSTLPLPPCLLQKKKKEIATFVCVFYSDLLPSPSPIENRDVGRKYLGAFFEKGSVVGVVIGLTKAREKVNQDIFLATAINETERLALSHAPSSHSITSFCCCCSISLSLFFVCSKKGGVQEENSSSAANAPAPPPPRRLKLHRSFSGLLPSLSLALSF